ncbi:hypothetical protein G210_2948 [Candida maltosa Xu316]|uniref:tRNA wybutosine-synthesizing protein 4 n=1 Tax=Candida maltosa (strain Xu316) TaxID=1245528 RepID=M3JWK9_CANMX|nr:hypothetical protein G210_2948 [Candida maltosa Xu316]
MTAKLTPDQLARQRKKLEKDKRKKVYDDQQVQGTNNSSIVSKRSVEKLYTLKVQPELGEFFKYFVPKGKRRSPAINRGYWIRMESIRRMVEKIITINSDQKINVINLGCGFDPLAFQLLHVYQNQIDLNFIDIDYPDLIQNKSDMIQKSPEIKNLIGVQRQTSDCLIETDNYKLVGCDLKHSKPYQDILDKLITQDTVNIFIAEVSLAYNKPEFANPIIEISSKVPNSHFLILEQIMPDGATNSFATKMLYHFSHLRSPIQCVESYPTKSDQLRRFDQYYRFTEIKNLFENWKFLIEYEMKAKISEIEDFDEWEEFIIFCQHYVIVHGCNVDQLVYDVKNEEPDVEVSYVVDDSISMMHDDRFDDEKLQLKFPAGGLMDGDKIYINGGLKQTRNDETLEVDLESGEITTLTKNLENDPSARMCHSITSLNNNELILIGGRSRPGQCFKDIYRFKSGQWEKLTDLPNGRSRHSAIAINNHQILIFGGLETNSSDLFVLYDVEDNSYKNLKISGVNPGNLKSASVNFNGEYGLIYGGIDDMNIPKVNNKLYKFTVSEDQSTIHLEEIFENDLLARIGSKFVFLDNDTILLIGGVSPLQLFTKNTNIMSLNLQDFTFKSIEIPLEIREKCPPIFVGFEVIQNTNGYYIIGGGAVCYSFGSCYNSVYRLSLNQ